MHTCTVSNCNKHFDGNYTMKNCRVCLTFAKRKFLHLGAILLKNNRFGTEMYSIVIVESLGQLLHHQIDNHNYNYITIPLYTLMLKNLRYLETKYLPTYLLTKLNSDAGNILHYFLRLLTMFSGEKVIGTN